MMPVEYTGPALWGYVGNILGQHTADRLGLTGNAKNAWTGGFTIGGALFGHALNGQCFPALTPILLAENTNAPISTIAVGDHVLVYDQFGELQPRRVTKLYRNVTTEWLELVFTSADGEAQTLTVTAGHRFLNEHGRFEMIADIAARGGRMIDAGGRLVAFRSTTVAYSADTAHLYEQGEGMMSHEVGNLALKPEPVEGWATYNFEVEDLHKYVACNIFEINKYKNYFIYNRFYEIKNDF